MTTTEVITLTAVINKMFVSLIPHRLTFENGSQFCEQQARFKLECGCGDHIFCLALAPEMQESLLSSHLNLKAAFDSVD